MNEFLKVGFSLEKPNGTPFELNEDELTFSNAVISLANEAELYPLNINFLSGNVLNYKIGRCQIGRIKLRSKSKTMQIISDESVNWLDISDVNEAIKYIRSWIEYACTLDPSIYLYDM